MSDPATFGLLMDEAEARHDAAQWRVITCRFVDEAAARATIAARASMLAALREQVEAIREFPSIEDLRALDVDRFLADGVIAKPRGFLPERTTDIERWRATVDSIIASSPHDDGSPAPAADRYREATQLIRGATDLLDTHRTTETMPQLSPAFGSSRPALELAMAASEGSHFLMTRTHQAGVRAKEIRAWLPVGHDVQLHDASAALLAFTPEIPDHLQATRLAGTVRTDTFAHEWSGLVDRVAARLDRLASTTEVDVRTLGYVAFVALLNDRITGGRDAEQWRFVVDQLRGWKGVSPADPRIVEDQRRLRAIALQISAAPRAPQTRDVIAAGLLCRVTVDAMASTANTIMPSVRRWQPAEHKPTQAYLQEVKAGPNLVRFAPTQPAQLWPTSETDPLAL